jgi:hypothetical protein
MLRARFLRRAVTLTGRRAAVLIVTVASLGAPALAARPAAAAATQPTFHLADGLTIFGGGVVEDPDGRFWVGDHLNGFCRLAAGAAGAVGSEETGTCLGGLNPVRSTFPVGGGQPAWDPAHPEIVYIPDNNRRLCEVARALWNPSSHLYDFDGAIPAPAPWSTRQPSGFSCNQTTNNRALGATIAPDGSLYVLSHRTDSVLRVQSPETARDASTTAIAGEAAGGLGVGGTTIASGFDRTGAFTLFMIEINGAEQGFLTTLHPGPGARAELSPLIAPPDPTRPCSTTNACVASLAFDAATGMLYVGTNTATADFQAGDRVDAFDMNLADGDQSATGVVSGLDPVVGITVRRDGSLAVLDDPQFVSAPAAGGTSRALLAGPPSAFITGGPVGLTNLAQPTFTVTGDPDSTLECSLVAAGSAPAFQSCGGSFTPAAALVDGSHEFAVRATSPRGTGTPVVRGFLLDTVAPAAPVVLRPAAGSVSGGSVPLTFDAAEFGLTFSCELDGTVTPCTSGSTLTFAASATHTIRVRATDPAGNVSAWSATVPFSIDLTGPSVTVAAPAGGAITFTADPDAVSFGCALDGATQTACTSPVALSSLAPGPHTLAVQGFDALGNPGTVALRTWEVAAPPLVSVPPPAPAPAPVARAVCTRVSRSRVVCRTAGRRIAARSARSRRSVVRHTRTAVRARPRRARRHF